MTHLVIGDDLALARIEEPALASRSRASIAAVKSSSVTASAPRRVASTAASFTRFARSAPENPGVNAAICSSSAFGASVTSRGREGSGARPILSGRSTSTCRSKRPARSSAGSRISGRLVAASRTRPVAGRSRPSREELVQRLLLLVVAAPAAWRRAQRPSASSSSRKMIAGAAAACSKRSRTRAAPRPTNISTNSGPRSRRTARPPPPRPRVRAGSYRCRAGREQHAFGHPAPEAPVPFRVLQKADDLELRFRLVDAGDVLEVDGVIDGSTRRDFSTQNTVAPPRPPERRIHTNSSADQVRRLRIRRDRHEQPGARRGGGGVRCVDPLAAGAASSGLLLADYRGCSVPRTTSWPWPREIQVAHGGPERSVDGRALRLDRAHVPHGPVPGERQAVQMTTVGWTGFMETRTPAPSPPGAAPRTPTIEAQHHDGRGTCARGGCSVRVRAWRVRSGVGQAMR